MLTRDASSNVHAIAWGILMDRTVESFERFFRFVSHHCMMKAFMCDRCLSQGLALKRAFGEDVKVLNCCIHIGRNIKQNTGPNSELLSRFWAMRKHRTQVFEESFVDSLNGLHAVRPSHFTASLLKSLDTFLPSKTDSVLKRPTFSALVKAKSIDLTSCCPSTQLGIKAKVILTEIQSVDDVYENVHSRDNTNTIEGYFSIIKRRVKKNSSSLLDLFEAINFTEATTLASRDPSIPSVPRLWKSVCSTFSHRPCLQYCQRVELMVFF